MNTETSRREASKVEITKAEQLKQRIESYTTEDIIVAFSGGVDSCLILKLACNAAKAHGTSVHAMTFQTKLHPSGEASEAKKIAEEMGAVHTIVHVDELNAAGIEMNPTDRCYRCKKYMFTQALEAAEKMGIRTVLDGTNFDDTKEYRPGLKALAELGVHSPLKECEFTKAEVRSLAAEYGISSAQKPSNPCMATRFPYDTKLSYEKLHRAEAAEEFVRSLGFYNVRARIHDKLVRIEVDKKDIPKLVERSTEVIEQMKQLGYLYVSVDLEGFRSGSQDVEVKREEVK